MKNKLLFVLAFVFLAVTLVTLVTETARADTIDVQKMLVYVRGELVWAADCSSNWNLSDCGAYDPIFLPSLEEGENVDIKVVITGGNNPEPVQHVVVRAWTRVAGSTIEDESSDFDFYQDNQYTKTLYLKMPANVKVENKTEPRDFVLHIDLEADEPLSGIDSAEIKYDVQRLSEFLSVKSINMRTSCTVYCNSVYADVVVKNTGAHDVEDIYVKGTIKELGISTTAYIDQLVAFKTEDEDISRQVTLTFVLPSNVQPGTYTLEVRVSADDVKDTIQTQQFVISGSNTQTPNVEVVPQVVSQEISEGGSVTYSMIVTNQGTSTQTFTVDTTGLDWATVQVTPNTFSLAGGESKIVNVYVNAKDGIVSGQRVFSAKVRYGQESKTVSFTADVTGKSRAMDIKTVLMIVGIVLAVAIIILLIVLLAQKTKTEEKAEESYY